MTAASRSDTEVLRRDGRTVGVRFRPFTLEVLDGPDAGARLYCTSPYARVGTEVVNDLRLTDGAVSRGHFRVEVDGAGYLLRDLGSTNGTTMAGLRVREAYLPDGVLIGAGNTRLRFTLDPEPRTVELDAVDRFGDLIARSAKMREVFDLLRRVAPTPATVVIEGETGTGKDVAARAIHQLSARAGGPFVVFDCGAVAPTLVEADLFGYEKGAFTGAAASHAGAFERANGGTLLFDEIGELRLDLQPKLLRLLDEGGRAVKRLGASRPVPVDVRVLAATNKDLGEMIASGRFREDLYYRISVVRVRLPPLRERREDIPLLAAEFLRDRVVLPDEDAPVLGRLVEGAVEFLRDYEWPGNVRELRNVVMRATLLGDGPFTANPSVPARLERIRKGLAAVLERRRPMRDAKADFERDYLVSLLRATAGDLNRASEIAQVHRKSLERLLRRYRIDREELLR